MCWDQAWLALFSVFVRLEIEPGAGYYDNISDNEPSVALITALSHVCIPLIIHLTIIQQSSVSQTNRGHCLISLLGWRLSVPACSQLTVAPFRCLKTWLVRRHWTASRARTGTYSQNDLMRMKSSSWIRIFSINICICSLLCRIELYSMSQSTVCKVNPNFHKIWV